MKIYINLTTNIEIKQKTIKNLENDVNNKNK